MATRERGRALTVRPAGPPRGKRVTRYVRVRWTDCPRLCSDVIHEDKVVRATADDGTETLQVLFNKVLKPVVEVSRGSYRALKLEVLQANLVSRRECEARASIAARRARVQERSDGELLGELGNGTGEALYDQADDQANSSAPGGSYVIPEHCVESVAALLRDLPALPSKEQVEKVVWQLPCLKPSNYHHKLLFPGFLQCYANGNVISTIHGKYSGRPGSYFIEVLEHLVPREILSLPHLTAKGTGGSVGLPEPIMKALEGYIAHWAQGYRPRNGWANTVNNHMATLRQKQEARVQQAQATETDTPMPSSSQSVSRPAGDELQTPNAAAPVTPLSLELLGSHRVVPTATSTGPLVLGPWNTPMPPPPQPQLVSWPQSGESLFSGNLTNLQ